MGCQYGSVQSGESDEVQVGESSVGRYV